jgi:hypothetical protein
MKHLQFHLPSFLRRVRIHGGEFDSSARAMNRVSEKGSLVTYERAFFTQADLRIVRGSTIERKHMSTKTTFKRIALVAVAALGFGVLSVVPSQATVSALTVSTPTEGSAGAFGAVSDSTTASTFSVSALFDGGIVDTVTVSFVQNGDFPATAAVAPRLAFLETTTAAATRVDTSTAQKDDFLVTRWSESESITANGVYSISRLDAGYAGAKFGLFLESATSTTRPAGTYNFTIIVKQYSGGVATPVTTTYPAVIKIAAAAAAKAAVASAATAYLQAGLTPTFNGVLTDSVTAGSFTAGTVIGKIQVKNQSAAGVAASDTITVSMTGSGTLSNASTTGRSFTVTNVQSDTFSVVADGTSGTGTITITTAAGASFVKTVTFFDTKPVKVTATVQKAFIKAGTGSVADVFGVVVTDTLGNPIKDAGAVVTAAATDTATTVGGAATCAWDATADMYECAVAGKAADKFGPVAYTITATGTLLNAAVKVTTSATVTFADNVATKAVLAGPASGTPGATVEYTLTLTEKNGYPVADQTYGVVSAGGVLFSAAADDRVVSGWTGTNSGPFSASESFTSKSGVITSKGILPIAGVATGSWTLVGDGLQTIAGNAIDKTIGKTKLTVSTEVANPGVDAATDAANEATDAANAATDAALAAAEAADAATTAAQEASDAVAALSETVTKLISDLQAQIKSLAAVVAKIAKKVKA